MADWRKCNMCKKMIPFGVKFWICSVSTCHRRRVGLHFCTVGCYDAHLPAMNHRESWALEVKAPSTEEWTKYAAAEGEDAIWPAPQKVDKEEAPLPSGGFGAPAGKSSTIRRRKT